MSPAVSHSLLKGLHGGRALDAWQARFEATQQRRQDIEDSRLSGDWQPLYRFNDGVLMTAISRQSWESSNWVMLKFRPITGLCHPIGC